MRIAIVDDDAADRNWLSAQLNTLLSRRRLDAETLLFESGERFLSAARETPFGLAFLDIYMDGMDGVAAARALRKFDPDCLLVFSTTSPDHALDGYRVQAVQYLVKPYAPEALERLFTQLDQLLPPPEQYIDLRSERQSVRVRLRDIQWANHFKHQMLIHTAGGREVHTRLTFGEFSALLSSDPRFFVCGRGLVINLDYAADFDGSVFQLCDGTRLPVSRSLTAQAKSAFGDRLFQSGRGPSL